MNRSPVRVRFAPSPTGYLHVGGARTALFNWLLARQSGGAFILRIEDTDRTRHVEDSLRKIMADLRWLGLQWDEGPEVGGPYGSYFQSECLARYHHCADRLLRSGNAYYAWETPEELNALREQARREKRAFKYPRPDPLPTIDAGLAAQRAGKPVVVRFKMPESDICVSDVILGEVEMKREELEDFVILKSDGWPTYHFAVVVDDHEMQITHVLRGQEHLMNTPKHIALQRALGFDTPVYAHLPIIMNMDGSKMSKRDKDRSVRAAYQQAVKAGTLDETTACAISGVDAGTFVEWRAANTTLESDALRKLADHLHVRPPEIDVHDFRASGYLPEALTNFLALLGWSPGHDREILTRNEMVELFSIERIGKTSARFDREKLLAFNTQYCAAAAPQHLLAAFRDYAEASGSPLGKLDDTMLLRVLEVCRGMRTLADVDNKSGVLFVPDEQVRYEPDAVRKVLEKKDGQGYAILERLLPVLESTEPWTAEVLDAAIKSFAEQQNAKLADVAQPLRVALTGRTISPTIGETLALLGRGRTHARVRRCLSLRGAA
ncbi:MAG TPA: glutamate--tRNA ligase [Phycisphaerae bacterium]|jgi:glutamyl-tRNA synthetase